MKLPKRYKINRYYQNNPKYFKELRNLVTHYPKQFTRMILAKGRKREGSNNWKLKYLYEWIIIMTKMFVEVPTTLTEKIAWIMNNMIDYPKCPVCQNKIKKYLGNATSNYSKHCCYKCSNQDPQTQLIKETTCMQRYGAKNIFASEYGKTQIKNTCIKNYGVPYSGMATVKKKHTEETCLRKYGVKNVNQCPKIKQKGIDTALSKHDHLFNYCKYQFDNRKFDSSWELMYYIYLKDHKIFFEYNKKGLFFIYEENGKMHRFYPYFIVNGEIQEIKGNQFFNDKGEPYNKQYKIWWWEKYYCILNNNIKLLRESDLKHVFEYFNSKYGKSFIKSCLIVRNKIKINK